MILAFKEQLFVAATSNAVSSFCFGNEGQCTTITLGKLIFMALEIVKVIETGGWAGPNVSSYVSQGKMTVCMCVHVGPVCMCVPLCIFL